MKIRKTTLTTALYSLSFSNPISSQKNLYAGYPIFFANDEGKTKTKSCTAAFIGNNQGIDGFITSAQCCVSENCLNGNVFNSVYENKEDNDVTNIGGVHDIRFGNGLEYVFITSTLTTWDNILYTVGLTSQDGAVSEIYPVTSYLTPNETGLAVCAYGSKSGYNCGNLTEIDLKITVPNPWNSTPVTLNVNKVDLGTNGFLSGEDLGGPVYIQVNNNGTITAQALGHIVSTNNDDANHKFFCYMPIEKVLSEGIITLTTRFPQQKTQEKQIQKRQETILTKKEANTCKVATIGEEVSSAFTSLVEVSSK